MYLDGVLAGTVDCYGSSTCKVARWSRSGLDSGSHTLKVAVTGTKNSSSKGYTVGVDAFDVGP